MSKHCKCEICKYSGQFKRNKKDMTPATIRMFEDFYGWSERTITDLERQVFELQKLKETER